jgi:hypothetical protein
VSERTFDLQEAVEVLAAHNDWRSGAVDVECIPTPILTEAFNVIIDGVRAQRIAAALNAQPQARVERYGDGVLVHWPDGRTDQYIQVGDCVTGKVQPQAEPAAFFPNRLPDVDASDAPAHWYHKGWNDCRTQALHARAPQPQASRVELRGILDAIGEWQSGCSQGGPGECRHCSEALIEAIEAKAKRGLGVQS